MKFKYLHTNAEEIEHFKFQFMFCLPLIVSHIHMLSYLFMIEN
jgi:hypothetical protein